MTEQAEVAVPQAPQAGPPQPQPVPTAWALGIAQIPGGALIGYQFFTPTGTFIVFLPVEESEKFADAIKMSAMQAKTGITVASAADMPRDPRGGVLLGR